MEYTHPEINQQIDRKTKIESSSKSLLSTTEKKGNSNNKTGEYQIHKKNPSISTFDDSLPYDNSDSDSQDEVIKGILTNIRTSIKDEIEEIRSELQMKQPRNSICYVNSISQTGGIRTKKINMIGRILISNTKKKSM
jgi:hypothetical protein